MRCIARLRSGLGCKKQIGYNGKHKDHAGNQSDDAINEPVKDRSTRVHGEYELYRIKIYHDKSRLVCGICGAEETYTPSRKNKWDAIRRLKSKCKDKEG